MKGTPDMPTPTDALQTKRDKALIDAINAGEGRLRRLQAASGYASTSAVKYALERLASDGKIVILTSPQGARVYTGKDYAAGWDAAARLAGNPDA